jgi:alkyl hydroperoxide reductase subunit AhpC
MLFSFFILWISLSFASELIAFDKKLDEFKKRETVVISVSVDSE